MDELKCPWCGCYAGLDECFHVSRWWCSACGAIGPWRSTRDEAVGTMAEVRPVTKCAKLCGVDCPSARADAAEAKLAEERASREETVMVLEEMRTAGRELADLVAIELCGDYRPDFQWCDAARSALERWAGVCPTTGVPGGAGCDYRGGTKR